LSADNGESDVEEIGKRVRDAIVARGMTQMQVARSAGCHASVVSRLSNGLDLPGAEILGRIYRAVGLDKEPIMSASRSPRPSIQEPEPMPSAESPEGLSLGQVGFLIDLGRLIERYGFSARTADVAWLRAAISRYFETLD
jgi:transcriptional regulator with XRE-family HTH domain